MNLKLVKHFPCDECGTELHKDLDYGYEDNQALCQECYNKAIDTYEGELIETQAYDKAYQVLLHKYNDLQTKLYIKTKKLKKAKDKLKEIEARV